jgi:hypothetical protein
MSPEGEEYFDKMAKLLDELVPCNVVIQLELLYTTHKNLKKYTHKALSQYTHSQVRYNPETKVEQ